MSKARVPGFGLVYPSAEIPGERPWWRYLVEPRNMRVVGCTPEPSKDLARWRYLAGSNQMCCGHVFEPRRACSTQMISNSRFVGMRAARGALSAHSAHMWAAEGALGVHTAHIIPTKPETDQLHVTRLPCVHKKTY